jgi:hypothetical protein
MIELLIVTTFFGGACDFGSASPTQDASQRNAHAAPRARIISAKQTHSDVHNIQANNAMQ